jgi:hypothetical protein
MGLVCLVSNGLGDGEGRGPEVACGGIWHLSIGRVGGAFIWIYDEELDMGFGSIWISGARMRVIFPLFLFPR